MSATFIICKHPYRDRQVAEHVKLWDRFQAVERFKAETRATYLAGRLRATLAVRFPSECVQPVRLPIKRGYINQRTWPSEELRCAKRVHVMRPQ